MSRARLIAQGRARSVLFLALVGSWLGQVPAVFLCTRLWRDDLVGLYAGTALGYALLLCMQAWLLAHSDWNKYAREARERSEATSEATSDLDEQSPA